MFTPAVQNALSRRSVLLGGLGLAASLTGCAGVDAGRGTTAAAAAGFPRRVDTALGPVEIAKRPERVVTLGREAEVSLALGVVPVGMAKGFRAEGAEPYLADPIAGKDVTLLDSAETIPYEQLAALRPDVILAGTRFGIEPELEQLAKIAPVVTFRKGSFVDTWQDQAGLIGEALGAEQRAAEVVAGLEKRLTDLAATHPEWAGRTFTLSFNYQAGTITSVIDPDDFAIRLMNQLGLVLSPTVQTLPTAARGQPDVSYELVSALDADVMLLAHASPDVQGQLEAAPVFASVPAVRDGRYVDVDLTTVSVLRTPMVLGIGYALDQLVPGLERAFPGGR